MPPYVWYPETTRPSGSQVRTGIPFKKVILLRYLFLLAATCAYAQFVPADFQVPASHQAATFQLKPLGPALAKHDFDAYMASIEHLQKNFSHSDRWPHEKITMADAIKDVEGEEARFQARKSFTYAVLSLDGTKELGCVYISPSRKEGFDANVRLWVTKAEFDKGLQPVVLAEVKAWLAKSWPFKNVSYPN